MIIGRTCSLSRTSQSPDTYQARHKVLGTTQSHTAKYIYQGISRLKFLSMQCFELFWSTREIAPNFQPLSKITNQTSAYPQPWPILVPPESMMTN